jgi:hypothetical protein
MLAFQDVDGALGPSIKPPGHRLKHLDKITRPAFGLWGFRPGRAFPPAILNPGKGKMPSLAWWDTPNPVLEPGLKISHTYGG